MVFFAAGLANAAHGLVGLAGVGGSWAVGGAALAMLNPAVLVTLVIIGVCGAIWGMAQMSGVEKSITGGAIALSASHQANSKGSIGDHPGCIDFIYHCRLSGFCYTPEPQ